VARVVQTGNDPTKTKQAGSAESGRFDPDRLKLPLSDISHRNDPADFDFETTDDLPGPDAVPGQQRAVDAIAFALAMERPGYNLFAIGSEGLGKRRIIEGFLHEKAKTRPVPTEYCYVNNFSEPHKPIVLLVPAGRGSELKDSMAQFVVDVKAALAAAFSSEEYRAAGQVIEREVTDRQNDAIKAVKEEAGKRGIALLRTPLGFGLASLRDGKTISPQEFHELPEDEQQKIKDDTEELEQQLHAALQKMPVLIGEAREKTKALNEKTARFAVEHMIETIKAKFEDLPQVVGYLENVEGDVVSNAETFLAAPEEALGDTSTWSEGPTLFWRYRVNLLIDHSENGKAPVVFEDEPTFERLLGRIEHRSEKGTLVTDFNLIRPGSLHKANGGYLLIDVRRLLRQPLAWDALKRVLEAGEIRIETLASALGFTSTTTLEPEPVPLNVKVVLIGERIFYYMLSTYDPDFRNHFKVLADFEEAVEHGEGERQLFVQSIAALVRREKLKPFDRTAVAALLDSAARQAEDTRKLSADFEQLCDLMREADFVASQNSHKAVSAADINTARAAEIKRKSRVSERLREAMERQLILIDTDGERVGQVNGLSVFQLGDMAFGKPNRITARVSLGRGDLVDIEREVELGGPIHSKGVLILSGYLRARYAPHHPLSLSASLVFEQSYGGVEGDSASAAELFSLLSALADMPIRQLLAVTGSVNQHGEIQVIGGVNEKIEGFFDLCAARGLNGDQGVLIPAGNVQHLVLDDRVLAAVEAGTFHLYGLSSIDEGIEILTGQPAGQPDEAGLFPEDSVNGRVQARLFDFAQRRRAFARAMADDEGEKGS
jgi:predicted ATP-dependent protease